MSILLGSIGYILVALFLGVALFDEIIDDPLIVLFASAFWIASLPITIIVWLALRVRQFVKLL